MDIMNCSIKKQEVERTFETCTGAPGPDGFHGNLIDKAREMATECLLDLSNKAWEEGVFIEEWKKEHRAVLPKLSKTDFHNSNAYRTVSLTAVLGKRYEKITSKRLISCIEGKGFDLDQYAYLEGRSSTQALLYLIETIKIAKKVRKT